MKIITPTDEITKLKSRELVQLECYNCGSTYQHTKHRFMCYKRNGGLCGCFCSIKCSGEYEHKMKTSVITCDHCNKSVIKFHREIVKSKVHFCSRSCSARYWNNIRHPLENRKVVKKRIPQQPSELKCSNCDESFFRKYVKPNHNKKRFCSKSCQAIYANKTWNRSTRFGMNKSRCETLLRDIILKSFPELEIDENNRSVVTGGLELDLYIPSKRVAIELNGPCHYIPLFGSTELQKTQNKDLLKIKYCQDNQIKLFVVNVMGVKNQLKTLSDVFESQIKPHLL
jgi:hypothetical protein